MEFRVVGQPRRCRDRRMQLAVRGFHAGADVEPLASPGLTGRLDERVDHVVDEHVVAGVGAVAEDLGRPPDSSAWAKIATTPASPCGSWRGP